MDLFGLAVLIGVFLAIDRRYLTKPDRLGYKGVPITHPMMRSSCFCWPESSSPVLSSSTPDQCDLAVYPWEVWSFVGWTLAKAFAGVNPVTAKIMHKFTWWIHTFLALGFIAYIPIQD